MKNKWLLFLSISQIVFGVMADISFFVLLASGENMLRFIPAAILAAAFIVLGIIGLFDYKSQK